MRAEVAVQLRQQELAQERIKAEIAVTQATGRANSIRAEAQSSSRGHDAARQCRGKRHQGQGRSARRQPEPGRAHSSQALERRAANHAGSGLGGAVPQRALTQRLAQSR